MELLEFVKQNENWEEILSKPPYSIRITHDGPYTMFKYNQIESDFSLQEVRESRGSIIKFEEFRPPHYVCRPFDKFFNYGEKNAADIDWNASWVTEKVDGSLMKMWWDGCWHLSTNGTIDAFKAPINGSDKTFGEKFEEILGETIDDFACMALFDSLHTWMFEMVSLETRVVIPYNDAIYYLDARNTQTGRYIENDKEEVAAMKAMGIKLPRYYSLHKLDDVLNVVSEMSKDEEGVVVCDKNGNRIKVKSPEYLAAAKLSNNGCVTNKRLFQIIAEGKDDDFLAYLPCYEDRVFEMKQRIKILTTNMLRNFYTVIEALITNNEFDRKNFANYVKDSPYSGYLFKQWDDLQYTPYMWLKSIRVEKVLELLGY